MRLACAPVLLAVALVTAPPARADAPRPLRGELAIDVPVTAGTLAFWMGTELAKDELAPARCRFCGTNALDAGARDLLVVRNVEVPRRASDVLAGGLLPAAVAAHQLLAARAAGDTGAGGRDLLYVAEAVGIAGSLNQIVKYAVGRQRPFVRYGAPGAATDPDDNLSFYSGHTSLAFSLVASAGTISTLRGYRSAPWVWGIGMTLATTVGYLRIAGDKHYLTDVLVGAAVGAGVGVAVPLALHGRDDRTPGPSTARGAQVIPLPLGVLVVF
jgi:hypothetical protein